MDPTMKLLSLHQKIFAVKTYYKNGEDIQAVLNRLREIHKLDLSGDKNLTMLRSLIMCFETCGSVIRKFFYEAEELPPSTIHTEEVHPETEEQMDQDQEHTETEEIYSVELEANQSPKLVLTSSSSSSTTTNIVPSTKAGPSSTSPATRKPHLPCSQCPKLFYTKDQVAIHESIHKARDALQSQKIICDVCGRTGLDKRAYKNHMMTHTGERPFKCTECPKDFLRKTGLEKHMLTHTGERPYTCEFCGAGFATWTSHSIHIRRHTGERPYECRHCKEKFIGQAALNVSGESTTAIGL